MGLFIIPSGKLTVCHGKSPSLIDKSANYMGHGFNRKLKQITRGYVMWLFGKTWSVPMCEHPNSWQKDVHILDVETNILAFIHLMTHKYIQYIYIYVVPMCNVANSSSSFAKNGIPQVPSFQPCAATLHRGKNWRAKTESDTNVYYPLVN